MTTNTETAAWIASETRPGVVYEMLRGGAGRWDHADASCPGWTAYGRCYHTISLCLLDEGVAAPQSDVARRFWQKCEPGTDGCWYWRASRSSSGWYGQFRQGSAKDGSRRRTDSHRVAYELAYGEIPAAMQVLHKCDHGLCVRPTHLFLGTQADNIHDMWAKGRGCTPSVPRRDATQ